MGKQLVNLPLTSNLVDGSGNLTAGNLIRNSDATYVNTAGTLVYSRGTRTNLVLYSEDTSQANWVGGTVQTFTLTVNTTYILSTTHATATLTLAAGTGAYTVLSGTTATYGSPVAFTMTTGGTVTVTTNTANPKAQLEALPSGNVIGSDLMDQETLIARTSGYTLVVGTIYKIISRVTLDFTTVGAADNTAGTYFICHTAAALGAGDAASDVTSPAKGSFHGTAMLAGSTELAPANNAASSTEANATTGWTNSGLATFESSTTQKYIGTYALHFVANGDGQYASFSFAATSGKLYKLEFYAYLAVKDADTDAFCRVGTAAGGNQILANATVASTATTWTKNTRYFVAPSTANVYVTIGEGGAGNDAEVYIDYVSVRQVQTTWTKQGTETIEIDSTVGTGGLLKVTGGDSAYGPYLALANANDMTADLTVGETYQLSFSAYVASGDTVSVVVAASDHTALASAPVTPTSSTAYTLYFKATHATTNRLEFLSLDSGDIIYLDSITIKAVPDLAYLSPGTYTLTSGSTATIPAEPRFEANGLLVEGEATNLVTYSNDFTSGSSWTGFNVTETANSVGPDGVTNSATTLQPTDTDTYRRESWTVASVLTSSAVHTFSVFVKAGTSTAFSLGLYDVTASTYRIKADFSITSGVVATKALDDGTAYGVISAGGGWYRVWASSTTGIVGGNSNRLDIYPCEAGVAHDANLTLIVYGAQLEATAFPTSYIPTNGCPVTRLTEAGSATNGYNWTMSTALKNALGAASPSRGTMLVDWAPGHVPYGVAQRGVISLTDDAANFMYEAISNGQIFSNDATNAPTVIYSFAANSSNVYAIRWDSTVAAPTTGALKVSEKHGGTWTHGTATNYDGAFILGTSLRIGYGNEYPFWIKNIRFFNGWVKDANLNAPIKGGLFPILPIVRKIKAYEY